LSALQLGKPSESKTLERRNQMTVSNHHRKETKASRRLGFVLIRVIALIGSVTLQPVAATAQSAKDVKGATPLVAIQNEPPVKLVVDPPIPEQLAQGRVFIQYRTENLRILPVYGKGALNVSPRVGHLHYFVDDQSWPIVDSSGETVVLVGLAPGPHKIRLELADATHKPFPGASQTVEFVVPDTSGSHQ
jgi:hypothetical protein